MVVKKSLGVAEQDILPGQVLSLIDYVEIKQADPERLVDLQLVDGQSHHPVLTDRFVLVPNPGPSFDSESIRVVFMARPAGPHREADR